mgnify:CR=1 FL=1
MYDDALLVLNKDKKLKKIISSVGECKIRTISNPFEALVEAIITQQISDSAGKSISLKFKNLLESIALRYSTIPVVLNLKSFNLVKLVNKNTVLDSAYIKPLYQTKLPEQLENIITQKKLEFDKVFCTNAYNRVFDIIGNELYGIDEMVELFEKTKFEN